MPTLFHPLALPQGGPGSGLLLNAGQRGALQPGDGTGRSPADGRAGAVPRGLLLTVAVKRRRDPHTTKAQILWWLCVFFGTALRIGWW